MSLVDRYIAERERRRKEYAEQYELFQAEDEKLKMIEEKDTSLRSTSLGRGMDKEVCVEL